MFELYADKNKLTLLERESVTSGSVNVYLARFEFSEDWEGLKRVAVFQASDKTRNVLLGPGGTCVIPWELLQRPEYQLKAGVYGELDGEIVLPTIWANLGVILEGVPTNGEGAWPPTPELWEQELERKGDGLELEGLNLRLMSGKKVLSDVELPPPGGGGGGGVTDHRQLTHRDAEGQHPMEAIEGLAEELRRIPAPVEPLTNEDLEELLK